MSIHKHLEVNLWTNTGNSTFFNMTQCNSIGQSSMRRSWWSAPRKKQVWRSILEELLKNLKIDFRSAIDANSIDPIDTNYPSLYFVILIIRMRSVASHLSAMYQLLLTHRNLGEVDFQRQRSTSSQTSSFLKAISRSQATNFGSISLIKFC